MVVRKTVLLAEDDENDILLLERAFAKAGIDALIKIVRDGDEAIQYLHGDASFANRHDYPLPELVLLDLKMPKASGFDVLKWVRHEPGLKRVLIVVLTSSDEPADVDRAYDLGANSYIQKPSDFYKLIDLAEKLNDYWLKVNLCPTCDIRPRAGQTIGMSSQGQRSSTSDRHCL